MQKNKQQWIMVMSRDKRIIDEWGMLRSFSIDQLGVKLAMHEANHLIEKESAMWTNMEYKLQGGEW